MTETIQKPACYPSDRLNPIDQEDIEEFIQDVLSATGGGKTISNGGKTISKPDSLSRIWEWDNLWKYGVAEMNSSPALIFDESRILIWFNDELPAKERDEIGKMIVDQKNKLR